MLSPAEINYIVVSDLHLTHVFDEVDRATDQAFIELLEHYRAHRAGGRAWRLILAGDTFDFIYPKMELFLQRHPAPDAPRRPVGASPAHLWDVEAVAWRLQATVREHAALFAALGTFLAAGNELVVVKGNHDIELHWSVVQQAFRRALHQAYAQTVGVDEGAAQSQLAGQVAFCDWFYLEPGQLYVEHGNQYDEINCWSNILDPARVHAPEQAFVPIGSRMTYHLTNDFVEYKPVPVNNAFMRHVWRTRQVFSRKFIGGSLAVMRHAAAQAGPLSEEGWQAGGGREDRRLLRVAERAGLDAETLARLQALQAPPLTTLRGFFFSRMYIDRVFTALYGLFVLGVALACGALSIDEPALSAAAVVAPLVGVIAAALRRVRHKKNGALGWVLALILVSSCVAAPFALWEGSPGGTFLVAWTSFVVSVSLLILPIGGSNDLRVHLRGAAGRVAALMGVAHVVFGHLHRNERVELEGGRWYYNTGAWSNSGVDHSYAHVALVRGEEGTLEATLHPGRSYREACEEPRC